MSKPSLIHQFVANVILPLSGVARRFARVPVGEKMPSPPRGASHSGDLTVTATVAQGWPALRFEPAQPAHPARTIVMLHGGAYVHEANGMHVDLCRSLARSTGATVVMPAYPLAPHATADTVVPVAADLISHEIARTTPEHTAVLGDSAGGGLALAATQELVRRGCAVPGSLVLLSPWLDVTVSDPRSLNGVKDPLLDVDGLRRCGRLWAGALDAADPLPSPIHGSMRGLPPIALYSGTRDVLYPDSQRLADAAREAGIDVDIDLRRGLIHDWAIMGFLPESAAVAARLPDQLFR
ncbi:alpha/beta hydrolase fold domain-containing protein [Microbacterium koreense]|uniref:Alpha/beta hydrolase fold domain-containing protein n=1 Tax=Microbacterium koreense TaxID=323761 RepID=A0ABW2ZQJ1_9MICO